MHAGISHNYFFHFSINTYVLSIEKNLLSEMALVSTNNVSLVLEIRKHFIFCSKVCLCWRSVQILP